MMFFQIHSTTFLSNAAKAAKGPCERRNRSFIGAAVRAHLADAFA